MARGEGGKGDGDANDASGCCLFWCPPCAVCANEGKYQYFSKSRKSLDRYLQRNFDVNLDNS